MSAVALARPWETHRLRDLVTKLVDGSHNPPEKQESGRPMLSARNVEDGRIVFENYRYISDDAFVVEHARTRIEPGDVLLTIVGTIGRSAVVPHGLEPFALQRSVAVLSPKAELLPKFLGYQLQSPIIQRHFEAKARGTAQKGVYLKTLGETPILVPPVDEQSEIVGEIEKQFSRLDEAVAGLQRVKANLKRYKAAVLKAAVEGRLVPTEADLARREGRSYETGAQLLQRILETRRSQWQGKGKYREPAAPDTTELPELPEGWIWVSASQVFLEVKDGTHETPSYHESGIPFITQKHVKAAGFVFDDYAFISHQDHDRFYLRSNAQLGDILVSMIGVNRGESCVVNVPYTFSIKNVGLLKPTHSLTEVKFIQYYLSSPVGQRLLLSKSKGGAQPFVGLSELRGWPVALPPLAEQHRIVAEVDRLLSIAREVETEVDTNLKRAQSLRQSVLAAAFFG